MNDDADLDTVIGAILIFLVVLVLLAMVAMIPRYEERCKAGDVEACNRQWLTEERDKEY